MAAAWYFFLLQSVQTGYGAPITSYSVGTSGKTA